MHKDLASEGAIHAPLVLESKQRSAKFGPDSCKDVFQTVAQTYTTTSYMVGSISGVPADSCRDMG
jgi:hypothetical protein